MRKNPLIDRKILVYAKNLRKNSTDAEEFLWKLLRNRRFAGLKFRRQYPIDTYILDFYCHEKKTAIELDGGQYNQDDHIKYDQVRDRWLMNKGIKILRFWNNEVLNNTEGVLQVLWRALTPTLSQREREKK